MIFFPNMRLRSVEPELMDDCSCDAERLFVTLKQFEITNSLLSRSRHLIKKILIPHMRAQGDRKIIFVDIGCGGCDIALWLANYCARRHINIGIICLDSDPRVIDYAQAVCRDNPTISVIRFNAFNIDKLGNRIDYVFSSHFFHHLPTELIPGLVERVAQCAENGFLISDLIRSRTAYLLYSLFGSLFLRKGFSLEDGRLSIRKGFTVQEFKSITARLNKNKFIAVRSMFPWRMYCYWLKNMDTDSLSGSSG